MSAVIVTGELKNYAWGRENGLASWTGVASGGPEAELWFGTHPAGPSPIKQQLGASHAFESSLLVKLLAAAKPLSIQIHPDAQAIGWIHEHGQQNLLADRGLKSEMLIALERFDVLVGLRDVRSASRVLAALGPDFAAALELLEHGGWRALIKWIVQEAPSPNIGAALGVLECDEERIMRTVSDAFAHDPGLSVAFLMQPHVLAPGEAVFVDVGTIHAYVGGLGVEVMVSCDNVLRLGLTPKEIAVDAALAALNPVGAGVRLDGSQGSYSVSGTPFRVQKVTDVLAVPPHSTVLCVSGTAHLSGPEGDAQLTQGEAALVLGEDGWQVSTSGAVWVATAS